jgi:hypothetical protein
VRDPRVSLLRCVKIGGGLGMNAVEPNARTLTGEL